MQGEIGIGKTLFARCLIEEVHNYDKMIQYSEGQESIPILTSSMNAEF